MHETDQLLALQTLDSGIDDCGNRRSRLPERQALLDANRSLAESEAQLATSVSVAASALARIEELERAGAVRTTKKDRLGKQLKTVIATREAEALMHEIAILDHESSIADDEELELIDAVEEADAASATTTEVIVDRTAAVAAAKAALAAAAAAIDAEVASLQAQRVELVASLPPAVVARFDSMRKSFGGIAISRLTAGRCGACHLDQSRATIEALRGTPEGTTVECEQCGRLLAV